MLAPALAPLRRHGAAVVEILLVLSISSLQRLDEVPGHAKLDLLQVATPSNAAVMGALAGSTIVGEKLCKWQPRKPRAHRSAPLLTRLALAQVTLLLLQAVNAARRHVSIKPFLLLAARSLCLLRGHVCLLSPAGDPVETMLCLLAGRPLGRVNAPPEQPGLHIARQLLCRTAKGKSRATHVTGQKTHIGLQWPHLFLSLAAAATAATATATVA